MANRAKAPPVESSRRTRSRTWSELGVGSVVSGGQWEGEVAVGLCEDAARPALQAVYGREGVWQGGCMAGRVYGPLRRLPNELPHLVAKAEQCGQHCASDDEIAPRVVRSEE